MMWKLAVEYNGEWHNMRTSWLSILVSRQTLIHQSGSEDACLVVTVSAYGLLARKAMLNVGLDGEHYLATNRKGTTRPPTSSS